MTILADFLGWILQQYEFSKSLHFPTSNYKKCMCNYQIRGTNNSLQKKSPLHIYAKKGMGTMQIKSQQRGLINGEWGLLLENNWPRV